MKVKRLLSVLLCVLMLGSLVACGVNNSGTESSPSNVDSSNADVPPVDSDVSGEGTTTTNGESSTDSSKSTSAQNTPSQSGATQKPNSTTSTGTKKPTTTKKPDDNFKGTTYYVSSSTGDDWDAEGTSPNDPFKSLEVAGQLGAPGDRVLFKRGDVWRGESMSLRPGVTYGAYGTGANPRFYGSAQNYSVKSKWKQKPDNSRIWYFDYEFDKDIGGIVFNEGAAFAVRKFKESDMKSNNDYYLGSDRRVYVYSRKGNPAEQYSSIEFISDIMVMNTKNVTNVTVRDITFKYIGRNAFHATGTTKNLRIENCEFSWLGGVLWGANQGETRLGNAITLWSSCYNVVVTNCKFYQIFDTAFTPQIANSNCSEEIVYDNIEFSNNTIDKCHWSTEFWIDTTTPDGKRTGTMKNIKIINNVMRNAGKGWSATQRGTAAGLSSCGHIETFSHECPNISNVLIKGNTFDGSASSLIALRWRNYTPTLEGNNFIQEKGKAFGYIGDVQYTYDDNIKNVILSLDKTAKVQFK